MSRRNLVISSTLPLSPTPSPSSALSRVARASSPSAAAPKRKVASARPAAASNPGGLDAVGTPTEPAPPMSPGRIHRSTRREFKDQHRKVEISPGLVADLGPGRLSLVTPELVRRSARGRKRDAADTPTPQAPAIAGGDGLVDQMLDAMAIGRARVSAPPALLLGAGRLDEPWDNGPRSTSVWIDEGWRIDEEIAPPGPAMDRKPARSEGFVGPDDGADEDAGGMLLSALLSSRPRHSEGPGRLSAAASSGFEPGATVPRAPVFSEALVPRVSGALVEISARPSAGQPPSPSPLPPPAWGFTSSLSRQSPSAPLARPRAATAKASHAARPGSTLDDVIDMNPATLAKVPSLFIRKDRPQQLQHLLPGEEVEDEVGDGQQRRAPQYTGRSKR